MSVSSETNVTSITSLTFRPEIEGLRALAVSFVVAYHARIPGFSGGFVGVDIFFVISGYLISGLLIEEHRKRGRIDFVRFYARRARRLLPAAFLMISITLIAANFIVSPLEYKELGKSGFFAALSTSNLWFAHKAADYFGPDTRESFFLHTWSLAVEEQFYLLWPASIALLIMVMRSTGRCIWTLATVSMVALFACAVMTEYRPIWTFYGTPFRIWEFGAGAIAYLLPVPENARTGRLLVYLGTALIVASGVFLDDTAAFPGGVALLPVLGTFFILWGYSSAPKAIPNQLLRIRPMQLLGRLSYSWYLWHWPFLMLGISALPAPVTPFQTLMLVAASFLAAWISFVLVENPVRRHPGLVAAHRKSLLLGLALALTAAGGGLGSYAIAQQALTEPAQLRISRASSPPPLDCVLGFYETSPRSCVFGSTDSRFTIVLLGDSHAHQWLPAIRTIAEQRHWRLVTFLKSACPTPDVVFYYYKLQREYRECQIWRNDSLARIRDYKPSVVFMVNSSMGYVGPPGSNRSLNYEDWANGLRRTLNSLTEGGMTNIVVLRDNPRPGISTLTCLSRAAYQGHALSDACVLERSNVVDDKLSAVERGVVNSYKNAHYVDLTEWFCAGNHCPIYRDGMIIYRDSNHLAQKTVLALEPQIETELITVIPGLRKKTF